MINAGQCPVSQLTNTSFKVEYSKSIVGDQTIFTCQSGLEPQEKMNATCRNSGNRTTNTADVICSNHSEGILKLYV